MKNTTNEPNLGGPVTLKVYNPAGGFEVTQVHAPRLLDLNGKTICELSNGAWESPRTFVFIRELLQKQFADVRLIPFTEFPMGSEQIDKESTIDVLVQKGCQAVITGNAA